MGLSGRPWPTSVARSLSRAARLSASRMPSSPLSRPHRSACASSSSCDSNHDRPEMILVVMCALDHAAAAGGNQPALVDEDEDYGFSALDGSPMHGRQLRHSAAATSVLGLVRSSAAFWAMRLLQVRRVPLLSASAFTPSRNAAPASSPPPPPPSPPPPPRPPAAALRPAPHPMAAAALPSASSSSAVRLPSLDRLGV